MVAEPRNLHTSWMTQRAAVLRRLLHPMWQAQVSLMPQRDFRVQQLPQ